MNDQQRRYLERTAKLEPLLTLEQTPEERTKRLYLHCDIRSTSREILQSPETFEAKKDKLVELLKQAGEKQNEYKVLLTT